MVTILNGIDESGNDVFYAVPAADLARYRVKCAALTEEHLSRLFPGRDGLTKDDADGIIRTAPAGPGDVEAFSTLCLYYLCYPDADDEYLYYWDEC